MEFFREEQQIEANETENSRNVTRRTSSQTLQGNTCIVSLQPELQSCGTILEEI